jgi:hypothetical protein
MYDDENHHGSPATNLTQLVPEYISQLPSSRLAGSVEYSVIDDGKAWQFTIHSRALSQPRLYGCRSTQKFSADEERRVPRRYDSFCDGIAWVKEPLANIEIGRKRAPKALACLECPRN